MDFDLSDEQRLLQETVAQFIDNECPMSRLRELFDDEVGFDPVLWKGLAELGLAGIHLPGEYGGSELEILDLAVVAETLGSAAAPVPFLGHALATEAIASAGSDEQKSRMLPSLASGEHLASVAFAEGDGVWLPGSMDPGVQRPHRTARRARSRVTRRSWSSASRPTISWSASRAESSAWSIAMPRASRSNAPRAPTAPVGSPG